MPDTKKINPTKKVKNDMDKKSPVVVNKFLKIKETKEMLNKANTAKEKLSTTTTEGKDKAKKLNDTSPIKSKVHTSHRSNKMQNMKLSNNKPMTTGNASKTQPQAQFVNNIQGMLSVNSLIGLITHIVNL